MDHGPSTKLARSHDILGVSPNASPHEVKEAYRELIKVWHPDRFAHDAKLQEKAQQKIKEINHAFEELSKPPAPVTSSFSHASEPDLRPRNPWPIFVLIAAIAAPLIYFGIRSVLDQRTISPQLFTQESGALAETAGPHRYKLASPSGHEFYIIEGPRVPLDWEIGALLDAYTTHTPRIKQSVGSFTISQASKPGDKDLTPLQYSPPQI